jgi:hypothetical protein
MGESDRRGLLIGLASEFTVEPSRRQQPCQPGFLDLAGWCRCSSVPCVDAVGSTNVSRLSTSNRRPFMIVARNASDPRSVADTGCNVIIKKSREHDRSEENSEPLLSEFRTFRQNSLQQTLPPQGPYAAANIAGGAGE